VDARIGALAGVFDGVVDQIGVDLVEQSQVAWTTGMVRP
jgi:hypothetical protein